MKSSGAQTQTVRVKVARSDTPVINTPVAGSNPVARMVAIRLVNNVALLNACRVTEPKLLVPGWLNEALIPSVGIAMVKVSTMSPV